MSDRPDHGRLHTRRRVGHGDGVAGRLVLPGLTPDQAQDRGQDEEVLRVAEGRRLGQQPPGVGEATLGLGQRGLALEHLEPGDRAPDLACAGCESVDLRRHPGEVAALERRVDGPVVRAARGDEDPAALGRVRRDAQREGLVVEAGRVLVG